MIAPKPAPVTAMQVEIARARAAGKERLAAPNLEALSPTMVKRKLEADHYCRGPNAETQYPADRWHDFWDESKNQEMRVGMGYIPVIDTKGNPVRDGLDQLFVIDDRLHQRGLEAAAAESRRLLNDGSPEVGESKSAKWSDGAVDEEISVTTGSAEDIERAAAAMSDDDG
ncbi:MAG: hypothetical protein GY851_00350 [bacterium]|nr:hypothetical protein [bacterium]